MNIHKYTILIIIGIILFILLNNIDSFSISYQRAHNAPLVNSSNNEELINSSYDETNRCNIPTSYL